MLFVFWIFKDVSDFAKPDLWAVSCLWTDIRRDRGADFYIQNPQLLLVIQNAAYWLLILAVKCWFWRRPRAATTFQTWRVSALFTAVCLRNHLNRFYFDKKQPDGNIKTFHRLSEQTVELTLSSHFAPGGAFYLSNFTTPGGCCYFRPPIMSLCLKFGWEFTQSCTHRRRPAAAGLFVVGSWITSVPPHWAALKWARAPASHSIQTFLSLFFQRLIPNTFELGQSDQRILVEGRAGPKKRSGRKCLESLRAESAGTAFTRCPSFWARRRFVWPGGVRFLWGGEAGTSDDVCNLILFNIIRIQKVLFRKENTC